MKYKVPCFWKVSGYHVIEAENLERAQEIADDPDLWVGEYAHLDMLPQPSQEESRDDFEFFPDQIEEADADEIATSETISDREALTLALEALRSCALQFDEDDLKDARELVESVDAAIEQAEKALAV